MSFCFLRFWFRFILGGDSLHFEENEIKSADIQEESQ